jgi:hypothetical protein
MQAELFPKVQTRSGPLLFLHPPFEVLLFLPLAYLPYPAAYKVWALINVSLLLLVPYLLGPYLSELKNMWRPFPVLFFLSYFTAFIAVLQGQDSILLLVMFTLAFVSLKKGHEQPGGCFLALGLFKFQFALPLLVPFLLLRRWKVVLAFLVVAALLVLLSVPLTGLHGTLGYGNFLWRLNRSLASPHDQEARAIYPETMPNIRGALYALGASRFQEEYIKLAVLLLSAALVIWVSLKWLPSRTNPASAFDLGFSLALVVALVVSYHLQLHDFCLLLLPAVLVLKHVMSGGVRSRSMWLALLALVTIFFSSPLYLLLMGQGRLHLLFWPILLLGFLITRELSRLNETGTF